MDETVPPTVVSPHETLAPTVQRPHMANAMAALAATPPPTGPTILLDQERLLSQVPRGTHEGKAAPVLGGIPLLSKIGQGGMGAVYYGICPKSHSPVAVKVLPLQLGDETHAVDRFLREARIATVVKSPHLVAVLDVGHDNGLYFFQMEYVRGKSAGGYLRGVVGSGSTGMDECTALEICIAATKGLAAAHEANIIHRDIKPDNILLPEHETSGELLYENAKLADLGLARSLADDQTMTATQTALGTPGYMAPEQCRDAKRAEMTADIFSMGATLYALLTGRPPFQGRTTVDTILATLTRQHLPVKQFRDDVSEMTCEVIERCLSKEPRVRYENAGKLLEALLTCRDLRRGMSTLGLGLRAPVVNEATVREAASIHAAKTVQSPTPRSHPMRNDVARRGPNVLALVLGLALIGGVAAWTLMPYLKEADQTKQVATAQPAAPQAIAPVAPATVDATNPEPATGAVQQEPSHPTPAELLLRKLHEGRETAAPTSPAVRPETTAVASREAKVAPQPSAEDQRRAKAVQQRKLEIDLAQAKAEKFAKDAEDARAFAQKAKSDVESSQRDMEKLQAEERNLKEQFSQMEMKMRAMQQQQPPPPRPGQSGSRGPGGPGRTDKGQPPPPPQQDPRVQQMMGQMMEMQNKLRDKMNFTQQQFRDRQQILNKAVYEQQKADGMAKMAADEVKRLKEKALD